MTKTPPKRPPMARLINAVGKGLGTVGIKPVTLTVDSVKRAAERATELSDYGSDSYMAGLDVLLWSIAHEAQLNTIGRTVFKRMIVGALIGRLTIVDWEKRNPEAAAAPIEKPLIIMGMPRTGTTILFETLAADPCLRAPLTWECGHYDRVQTIIGDPRAHPYLQKVAKQMALIDRMTPGFSAIHYVDPFIPTECVQITLLDLSSEQFCVLGWLPTYRNEWLLKHDYRSAYAWHKRGLRFLQARQPEKKWVLKSPLHSAYLPALLETYPDAQLIHTHRDPMQVITSGANLCRVARSGWSDASFDLVARGQVDAQYIAELIKRATLFRQDHPEHTKRFCDIAFNDFLKDPMAEIDRIHNYFMRDLPDASRKAMADYLQNRPRNKYGTHTYNIDDFRFTDADCRPWFAEYEARFGEFI